MKIKSESFNYIRLAKPTAIIIFLLNTNNKMCISDIARKINCTYAYNVKILQRFEKEGYIITKKSGRIRCVELTDKGIKIAKSLQSLKMLLTL